MYTIICYSPTGNTEFLAKKLNNLLDSKLIDITVDFNIKDVSENLIVMGSINAFNLSKKLVEYLKRIDKKRIKTISFIAVGCNTSWVNKASSNNLIKLARKNNWEIKLNRLLAMPLTIVYKFPKELGSKLLNESLNDLKGIKEDLINNKHDNLKIPIKSKMISKIGKFEHIASKFYGLELKVNKNCVKCKKCLKNCPSNNIRMKDNKIKFRFKCSMCQRCIYQCPTKAIKPRISKFIPLKSGYNLDDYKN